MGITDKEKLKLIILQQKGRKDVTIPFQITAAFCRHYNEYDNEAGRRKVSDVLNLKYTNKEITKKFVAFVDYIKVNGYK
jgi:hypothetical protein